MVTVRTDAVAPVDAALMAFARPCREVVSRSTDTSVPFRVNVLVPPPVDFISSPKLAVELARAKLVAPPVIGSRKVAGPLVNPRVLAIEPERSPIWTLLLTPVVLEVIV